MISVILGSSNEVTLMFVGVQILLLSLVVINHWMLCKQCETWKNNQKLNNASALVL